MHLKKRGLLRNILLRKRASTLLPQPQAMAIRRRLKDNMKTCVNCEVKKSLYWLQYYIETDRIGSKPNKINPLLILSSKEKDLFVCKKCYSRNNDMMMF